MILSVGKDGKPKMMSDYDIVKYVEENFGVELLEFQKEILRQIQSGKQIYVMPARYMGFTFINKVLEEDIE